MDVIILKKEKEAFDADTVYFETSDNIVVKIFPSVFEDNARYRFYPFGPGGIFDLGGRDQYACDYDKMLLGHHFVVKQAPTPQDLATAIVEKLQLPNHKTKLVFCGRLTQYGNNLPLLLTTLLGNDDPTSRLRHNIINLDFQQLHELWGNTPSQAKLALLDAIEQCKGIKSIIFPGELFFCGGTESKIFYHDRLAKIIQNNNETLETLSVNEPYYGEFPTTTTTKYYGPTSAPSILLEAIRDNDTLKVLHLHFLFGDKMMKQILYLMKSNCTLEYFHSKEFLEYGTYEGGNYREAKYHEHWEIISYYLALNNLGRKDWGKNLTGSSSSSSTKLNILSEIPKPEGFYEYFDDREEVPWKSSDKIEKKWLFSRHTQVGLKDDHKKELWYASFVYEFLHCNLDLFLQ